MSFGGRAAVFLALATTVVALPRPSLAASPAAKPTMVLVSLDTFRSDRLAPWGGRPDLAPNLNALCGRGIAFTRCFTPAPITLPAHATLLTSRSPSETGLHDNGIGHLETGGTPTLAEVLASRGYATAAVVSSAVLSSRYGLSRGFASYDDRVGPSGARTSAAVTDLALAALAARRGKPLFLWVHYFDTHAPYYSTGDSRKRAGTPYDASVATVDEEVGRLLKGLPPDSVVALVSDHGEGLGDHGEATHGVLLYQPTVSVVCVIAGPSVPRGVLSDLPSGLGDVAPTLLALTGATAPPGWRGRDLLTLRAAEGPPARSFPLEAWLPYDEFRWLPLTGVTDGRYKWVRGRWDRLYDLAESPKEATDRAADPPSAAAGLRDLLPSLQRPAGDEGGVDPALRGLGYAPVPGSGAGLSSLPDPESQLPVLRGMQQGRLARSSGDVDRSAAIFGELTALDPGNPSAWLEYAQTLEAAGRHQDAQAAALRALSIAPGSADAWVTLGHARLALGRIEEASEAYERAIRLSPSSVTSLKALAEVELERGQLKSASAHIERVARSEFADASALVLQGRIQLAQGSVKGAAAAFSRALALSPEPARTLKEEGDAFRLAGFEAEAENAYRRGIAAYPRFAPTYLALGGLYLRSDEPAKALPVLRRVLALDLPTDVRRNVEKQVADLEKALAGPPTGPEP